jgi:hypothetical protein
VPRAGELFQGFSGMQEFDWCKKPDNRFGNKAKRKPGTKKIALKI